LRVVALDKQPPKSASLRWRTMGQGEWQSIPLQHVARAVYSVNLPPATGDALEYYLEAETAGGKQLRWPVTAPALNQTVVVAPRS
jgi:hypothetical protein